METVSFPGLGEWATFTIDPVCFSIGSVKIYWYGVIIAVGFLLGLIYALKRTKTFGLNPDRVIDVIIVGVVGAVIGARLYFVAFAWDRYSDNPMDIFKIWEGGLAIYGGVIGAFIAGAIMCKIRKVKLLPMLDMAVGGLLIGQAVGRWGNFVNVEAFGSNTSLPWGMTSSTIIPQYLSAHSAELEKLGVVVDPTMPVHPTFLYESLWCLLGFILLALFTKHRRFDGELLLFYSVWYGVGRFVIEGLRTDSLMVGSIRISQLVALIAVLAGGITWLVVRLKIRASHDPEYLRLYVKTEESRLVVTGEYYEQLKAEKKACRDAKQGKGEPEEDAQPETGEKLDQDEPAKQTAEEAKSSAGQEGEPEKDAEPETGEKLDQ